VRPAPRVRAGEILSVPGAYEVDWWSPKPGEDWEPVKRGEFDLLVGEKLADGLKVQRWFHCPDCGYEWRPKIVYGAEH